MVRIDHAGDHHMTLHVQNDIGVIWQLVAGTNCLDHAIACKQATASDFPANIVTGAARHAPDRLHGAEQIGISE
jgi:hypothetical protein